MEIIKESFSRPLTSLMEKYMPEDHLFLDIETTGFRAAVEPCYLIGILSREGGAFTETQFFAENPAEEEEMLRAFLSELSGYRGIITFNGDMFDLPYLSTRCGKYGILPHFELFRSLDLYKEARRLNKYLRLSKLKQKSIEEFLGISREDRYHGGDLISVYQDFCRDSDPEKRTLLLLHNFEDVRGMLDLLPLLSYRDIPDMTLTMESMENENDREFLFSGKTNLSLPREIRMQTDFFYAILCGSSIKGALHLHAGTKKYFLPNPKQYVYVEDEALLLPKQLAGGIPKERKRAARKEECFSEAEGVFLPIPANCMKKTPLPEFLMEERLFRDEYTGKTSYVKVDPDTISAEFLSSWFSWLVSACL